MTCPNCNTEFNTVNVEGLNIEHCPSCGGTFFDDNDINRISLATAKKLAADETAESISSEEKICPKDGKLMTRLNQESIPQHITLLGCPKCKGIFAYPHDLIDFKKAQSAKIDFFKFWRIPLPSVQSVVVSAVFIFISVSTIGLTYFLTNQSQTISSNASEICQPIQIVTTESGYLLFCQTASPFSSQIKKICDGVETTTPLSNKLSTNHLTTVPLNCQSAQLIFSQDKLRIETEMISLE